MHDRRYPGTLCRVVDDDHGRRTHGACTIFICQSWDVISSHYGILLIIDVTGGAGRGGEMKVLYVFVEIRIEVDHLVKTIRHNFGSKQQKLALLGTIQFVDAVHRAAKTLRSAEEDTFKSLIVPQELPLSAGRRWMYSPILPSGTDAFIFVADGRFHWESAMIHNPDVAAYLYVVFLNRRMTHITYILNTNTNRYNPYSRTIQ